MVVGACNVFLHPVLSSDQLAILVRQGTPPIGKLGFLSKLLQTGTLPSPLMAGQLVGPGAQVRGTLAGLGN